MLYSRLGVLADYGARAGLGLEARVIRSAPSRPSTGMRRSTPRPASSSSAASATSCTAAGGRCSVCSCSFDRQRPALDDPLWRDAPAARLSVRRLRAHRRQRLRVLARIVAPRHRRFHQRSTPRSRSTSPTGSCCRRRARRSPRSRSSPRCSCTAASCTSSSTCSFLFVFGPQIEYLCGHVRFLALYLICGIAGGLAHDRGRARQATFPRSAHRARSPGILGAYIVTFSARRHEHDRADRLFAALSAVAGGRRDRRVGRGAVRARLRCAFGRGLPASSGGTAYFAHIGGFCAGVLLIGFFRIRPASDRAFRYYW